MLTTGTVRLLAFDAAIQSEVPQCHTMWRWCNTTGSGLGRVITRWRGCRPALIGRVCRDATVSSIFFRFRSGGKRGASMRFLKGFEMAQPREPGRSQAPIAAISGLTPRMFMARVRL